MLQVMEKLGLPVSGSPASPGNELFSRDFKEGGTAR